MEERGEGEGEEREAYNMCALLIEAGTLDSYIWLSRF